MKIKRVGIVIADEQEYVPIREYAKKLGAKCGFSYSREYHEIIINNNENQLVITTILCGIGKVNAAMAATYLAQTGADYIINIGLSGGMSGISRGEITVSTELVEHDFDLTPLGYKLGEKPLQKYVYHADKRLVDFFCEQYTFIKPGFIATGDSFICDDVLRKQIIDMFGAMSCDMEAAAIASVCECAGIPFIAVRKISDDAGADSIEKYTEMNNMYESSLVDLVFDALNKMLDSKHFF